MKDNFSLVIIDEATQAIEAESWIAIHNTNCKVIVAGDHNQLPPCIKSSKFVCLIFSRAMKFYSLITFISNKQCKPQSFI